MFDTIQLISFEPHSFSITHYCSFGEAGRCSTVHSATEPTDTFASYELFNGRYGVFENGIRTGLWTYFDSSGTIEKMILYEKHHFKMSDKKGFIYLEGDFINPDHSKFVFVRKNGPDIEFSADILDEL